MTDIESAPHIRRTDDALLCAHCKQTKPIRKKTTAENIARWMHEHARCRPGRKT